LAEKHNPEIVSHFLSLIENDARTPNKLPKAKLLAWLTLFSKFSNPKALHATETLRSVYLTLLSHPDRSLQTVSLSCLLAYKSDVDKTKAKVYGIPAGVTRRDIFFKQREPMTSDVREPSAGLLAQNFPNIFTWPYSQDKNLYLQNIL